MKPKNTQPEIIRKGQRKVTRDELILNAKELKVAKYEFIRIAIMLSADGGEDVKRIVKELKDKACLLNIPIDLIDNKIIELDGSN
jgi:hypothetical protein